LGLYGVDPCPKPLARRQSKSKGPKVIAEPLGVLAPGRYMALGDAIVKPGFSGT